MRATILILAAVAVILSTAFSALADDCEYIKENKECWESGSTITLGWTYSRSTAGGYQIEVRDFNWLGSAFIRVMRNNTVKEGMVSEGESYIFDFSTNDSFEGVKIIGDQISNINMMPSNIGTYPNNPQAKITIKLPVDESKKKPSLSVDISTEGEANIGSRITASIKIENSGDADLIDARSDVYFEGLKLLNEYDMNNGQLSEGTAAVPEIQWENVSGYRLTPSSPGIARDGYFIRVLNFYNGLAFISTTYNQTAKTGSIMAGNPVIFNFTKDSEYRGVKILGSNFSGDSAFLTLQFPEKNILKQKDVVIFKGDSRSIKLGFLIPVSSRKSFTIAVNISGKDGEGNTYSTSKSVTTSLSKTLGIKKIASNSILGERLYPESYSGVGGIRTIKNMTHVNIRVDNLQRYPVYGVRLTDSIPPGFNFVEDVNRTSISWVFDINASDYKEFTYAIAAKRQGVYNLPKAELTWSEWGEEIHRESESPRTTASGPYIGIDRSFNKSNVNTGDTLRVTLSIINIGDLPTNVTINDSVPQNTTFLSGRLSYFGTLNPDESANIVYNISVHDAGTIEFRPPELSSRNQGFEWNAQIPVKELLVLPPAPAASPAGTVTQALNNPEHAPEKGVNESLPWLEGTVSFITLIFAISLLLTLRYKGI